MALSVLVVGGGIGGLSLARELALRGLGVTVLERTAKLAPVGAGIILNPNAMAVLEGAGLADRLRGDGWPYLARETHDARGRLLAVRDYRPLYDAGRLARGALVHRTHLHQALHDGLPPATVHFGVRIARLDATADGVSAITEEGERHTADLLVGADGIRSTVRERFFGPNEPVYLGYRSHRFVVDRPPGVEHFTEFLGRGKRIGLVPISRERLYVWTTFNSPRASTDWALDRVERFRALFAEFADPRVRAAFAQVVSTEDVLCTDIEEVRQARWAAGRVVLLGDAAHALTPNMGQGAGMALEDAAVLAEELAAAARGTTALAAALDAYVARRRRRVETIVRLSRLVGEEGQREGALACWWRNRRIAREGRDVARQREGLARLLAWPPDERAAAGG
jgi:2-polyprenyl-6-methoxyphenol hydroxylase-like FAD-dependent oxidoreductase